MVNYTKINRMLFGLLGFLIIIFLWFIFNSDKNIIFAMTKAVFTPLKQDNITIGQDQLSFALPPFTNLLETGADYKKYLTFTTGTELYSKYYKKDLPDSGWNYIEQMGSGFFYKKNNYKLTSTRRGLIWRIEILYFSIEQKTPDKKKDLVLNDQ